MREGSKMTRKKAIIIGCGPAGITAAYELVKRTDIQPIIFESTGDIGGIAKTVNFKGNRIDIGGHRFFSKSKRVMDWWRNIFLVQGMPSKDDIALNRNIPLSREEGAPDPEKDDNVMLIRNRLSRIYHRRKFFDYPISLNLTTFRNLGFFRIVKIGVSYLKIRLFPIKEEKSLEDFFVNRFGYELYATFFRDYTEKVWGIPCDKIKPEWGAQRVKGLSISKAVFHAIRKIFIKDKSVEQRGTETSLIEQFLYPKYGPGQIWERTADIIRDEGGKIYLNHEVTRLYTRGDTIAAVEVRNNEEGTVETFSGDYFFSTMPVKDLINSLEEKVPDEVAEVANGLMYRDFITVGLLVRKLEIQNETGIPSLHDIIPDNWIYIQEGDVKVGRIQIFNNWSPYMVKDEHTVWMGLEYFCTEGDHLWSMTDDDLKELGRSEMERLGIIKRDNVMDSVVIRMKKTYPGYFGSYDRFDVIKEFTDTFTNLYLIGRNGMHRYNNQDHSMLTAMVAVDNIVKGISSKENIWDVNTEEEYHEEKS